ncbi:unnamed protein product [Leptidea sinapis]|uniref:Uncharacterized protein n=1 Tax=Leptidea sinapis TaxID=189913 RepID=A0A5E4R3T4_9NEOP|nr:unnamed protein product [Leptidea sinapis]
MSDMLEMMYHCIFEGKVPSFWQKGKFDNVFIYFI